MPRHFSRFDAAPAGVPDAAREPPPKSSVRASRLRSLEVVGREAYALAKQSTLFYRDVLEVVPQPRPGEDVVVFVHGLFQTAGVLRPVREQIARETRAETASFSYATGPGVVRIADRLAELIRDLPSGIRIHFVGHSVGGLVVRWYVQELGRDERVVQTISLGSPFSGTTHARYFPTQVGRDIVPGSRLLTRLAAGARAGERVPHLSITAAHDSVVPGGAVLGAGDTLTIDGCGHNGLIYHSAVAREIVRRVRTIQAAAELCAGF
jgi:triacylglycerol lipase